MSHQDEGDNQAERDSRVDSELDLCVVEHGKAFV
jgi:hypothetical protein